MKANVLSEVFKEFSGVGSDTRQDLSGKIFFALEGPQFDGHQFLSKAVQNGAKALVVHQDVSEDLLEKVSVLKVDDTLEALQNLAGYWRKQNKFQVLGITGSNGKTTTKEFTKQILQKFKKVYANEKSFNNHWGVPFSLLEASAENEVVICEMGMNHPGELEKLSQIALPDVVVCLNVGRAHTQFLPTLEDVAKAKEEIYSASSPRVRIFNRDNFFTQKMEEKWLKKSNTMSFSEQDHSCEVYLQSENRGFEGLKVSGQIGGVHGECLVNVFGYQNAQNLMAASALALSVGLSGKQIWSSLKNCRTYWGRNQVFLSKNTKIIFDAYNANPESMKALFHNLQPTRTPTKTENKKQLAILGEMMELGEIREKEHEALGLCAGQSMDEIWFLGKSADAFKKGVEKSGFSGRLRLSDDFIEAWAKEYEQRLEEFEVVAIKGSRGIKLEQLLKVWKLSESERSEHE